MLLYTKKFNRINTAKLIDNNFYKDEPRFFWENNKSNHLIIGLGCIDSIEILQPSDLNEISKIINKKLNLINDISKKSYITPKFFGGYAFDIKLKSYSNWGKFPRGYFFLPKCIITSTHNNTFITLIRKNDNKNISEDIQKIYKHLIDNKNISDTTIQKYIYNTDITKSDYSNMVNQTIGKIQKGHVEKVVLSRNIHLEFNEKLNLNGIIQKLRYSYPECINFYLNLPGNRIFMGSTPERLIQKQKSKIRTEAIAGTIKRSDDKKKDGINANYLKNDLKNIEEHQLVVKNINEILNPKLNNITISKQPEILKLKNVQHLITHIDGELKDNINILELVKLLHPTPAVSGYPVQKACELINKYEKYDRGWYCGPIGWVDSNGDGDFCVGLRSALINGNSMQLFSGGGIVVNSNADDEWEETKLKMKTILEIIKE